MNRFAWIPVLVAFAGTVACSKGGVKEFTPSAEEKAHWINNFERSYDGKLWGVPWYLSGNPFVYNPKLFEAAGVDATAVKTWDDLLGACAKLKASGVVPISGGLKDGWFGGWICRASTVRCCVYGSAGQTGWRFTTDRESTSIRPPKALLRCRRWMAACCGRRRTGRCPSPRWRCFLRRPRDSRPERAYLALLPAPPPPGLRPKS